MRGRAIIPLAIGLTVGIVAVKLLVDVVKRAKASTENGATVPVVTAAMEIPQGAAISQNMLSVKQVPANLCPSQHFANSQELQDRVTSVAIPKDMPVLASMLAPKGTTPGLGARIPDGMRAVAVKVDEWVGVGVWLRPVFRVDVAAVFTVGSGGRTQTVSRVILQNIEVAAVGGEKGQTPQDTGPLVARSVTLIVRPEDVSKIHLASEKGKIRLAMRNSLDANDSDVAIQSDKDLFGDEKLEPVASQPAEPQPPASAEPPKRCLRAAE